jgi:predicted nuclease with TOPRIM domain
MNDRNKADLKSRLMAISDAQDSLKHVKNEYEKSEKRVEEVLTQNNAMCARIEAQSATMKDIEDKLSHVYVEESELLTDFADYMAEVSTRFESYSVRYFIVV